MTNEDVKTAKKFVCAAELARVFKSMICLFLTTSFVLLRLKNPPERLRELELEDQPAELPNYEVESLWEVKGPCQIEYSTFELDPSLANYTFGIERYLQPQFVIEILLPIFSIGLTLISIMIEL